MGHIVVFIIIVTLAIGTAALNQSVQLNRIYHLPMIKDYNRYFIFANLITLLNLLSFYTMNNISSLESPKTYILIIIIMGIAGFTLAGFEIYFLGKAFWEMAEKELSVFIKIIFITVFSFWFIGFISGIIIYITEENTSFLLTVHYLNILSLTGLFFILPLALLLMAWKITNNKKRNVINAAAWLYMVLSIIGIVSLFLPENIFTICEATNALIINLAFLFFLKWFITGVYNEPGVMPEYSAAIELMISQYGISLREKEIVEMILKGLSNKEIEQKIFISQHTVKNHIYHIFQKLKINSRGQLINLIINLAGKSENTD